MKLVARLLVACCALAVSAQILAQGYPSKPIRFTVPFAPAGPTGAQARWAAQQLNSAFGQLVIVENRPGAGGVPGTDAVAKSAADGYTLLARPRSRPGHHIEWIMGAKSADEALKKLEPFKLDGVMQKMRCPFPLAYGADDEQIPLADAQRQFDACGSRDKTFRVFAAEEGGAQHCQRDYLTLVVAEMWNWFEDKLVRS